MKKAPSQNWLYLFGNALSCGPAVRAGLDKALGAAFVARIGAGLDGFMLVPPDGGAADIAVDAAGTATVSTDLVGPDAQGYLVTLAWRADGCARPLPADPALEAAAAAGGLKAWWAALPEDELRRAYATSSGPPWRRSPEFPFDARDYPFVVEWKPFPWPDLWLGLQLSGEAASAALPKVVRRLQAVQERWNGGQDRDAASGRIHQVGSQAEVVDGEAVVNVDFGSAGPAALVAMLRAIAEMTDGPPVRRVTVGSAVLARPPAN